MATSMYVLFEHATGYSLFVVLEFEEIGMLLPQVEASVSELNKFRSLIKLAGFAPFKTAGNALDNMNSISEGLLHEDLHLFLETNLPTSGKKNAVILGVADSRIGGAISESFNVQCQFTGVVPELIRGIRHHFPNLVKGFTAESAGKAQLGLGHSYSRSKVKFNVNRVDNMIIQSISLLDQMDKDVNTFSMRIREWYSYHFPELIKIVPENFLYAKMVQYIKNRKDLTQDSVEVMAEILMDTEKAQAVYDASKSSMGMDISPIDLINIQCFATRVIALAEYRKKLSTYLGTKMQAIAPNLATLIGDQVGARLISHAGSLTNLAKFPASTVQILGAEKALFRALKTKGNTPKYGLIFHSTFIGRAGPKNKGRISRYLANKCSIASRIDCFSEMQSSIFGEKLRGQVEERLKFYEMGDIPRKNVDVMKEAIEELAIISTQQAEEGKKKKKKKNKRSLDTSEVADTSLTTPAKKKKKDSVDEDASVSQSNGKKKKKNKESLDESSVFEKSLSTPSSAKKMKKKKSLTNGDS